MSGFDIFAIVFVLLIIFTLFAGVKTVPQGYDWTIERFGKFTRTLSPGLNLIIPYFDRVGRKMNMMEQVIDIPEQEVTLGDTFGKLVVVGWGSTFGPIHQAVRRARAKGRDVSHVHIRHIWPLPRNLGDLLKGYDQVLVPEMNTGQLKTVLRDQYLVDARPVNKVSGQPFKIAEIEAAIQEALQ